MRTQPKTLPRRSPEDRKKQIIEAAAEVLSGREYEDVPVSEIVKKAGVAQGTFYLYFPTKAAILEAIGGLVSGTLERQLMKVAEEQDTVLDVIREMHKFAQKTVHRFKGLVRLVDSEKLFFARTKLAAPSKSAEFKPVEPPAFLFRTLERLIRRDQERGKVSRDLDPVIAARLIVSVLDRYMRDVEKSDRAFPADEYSEQMMRFLAGALGLHDRKP